MGVSVNALTPGRMHPKWVCPVKPQWEPSSGCCSQEDVTLGHIRFTAKYFLQYVSVINICKGSCFVLGRLGSGVFCGRNTKTGKEVVGFGSQRI